MTKPTVYLFHGFNVRDGGQATTDRLRAPLERDGYNVHECDYLWKGLMGVRLCNRSMAKMISGLIKPGSIGIGHSNGCALLHHAGHFGAPFDRVVYINPALDRDADLAWQITRALVVSCPEDIPTWLARFIPGTAWGSMGHDGYKGLDHRYQNWRRNLPCDHSDLFRNVPHYYPRIRTFMEAS